MKKNVGTLDRMLRLLLAAVIAILYIFEIISGTLGIVLLVVAGVLILTSLINFCPIYAALGIRSNKKETNK